MFGLILRGPAPAILGWSEGSTVAIVTVCLGTVGGVAVALIQRPFKAKNANAQAESARAATQSVVAIEEVRAQTLNNGESTLRDALDRIDRRTEAVDRRVATMDERQLSMERWAMGFDQAMRTVGGRLDVLSEKFHESFENQQHLIKEIQTMRTKIHGADEVTPPGSDSKESS